MQIVYKTSNVALDRIEPYQFIQFTHDRSNRRFFFTNVFNNWKTGHQVARNTFLSRRCSDQCKAWKLQTERLCLRPLVNNDVKTEILQRPGQVVSNVAFQLVDVEVTFVEVPAIVDSEVDNFEMKNPPKSRTGAPLISAESLQQLVSQIERQWRRAQGTEE